MLVPGATGQSFTVTTSGSYAVILDDGWCVDTSACYFVVLDAIGNNFDFGIEIYPNPVMDFLTIYPEQIIFDAKLTFFDLTGQEVLSMKMEYLEKEQLDIRQLSQGIYFLRIDAEGRSAIRQMMKIDSR